MCRGIVSIGNKNTEEYSSKLYRVSFSGNNINYDQITDNIPADTYFNRFVVSIEESENKSAIDTVFYFWGGATDDSFYRYTLQGDESEETIEIYNPETGDFEEITTDISLSIDNDKFLNIYPNPTKDVLHFSSSLEGGIIRIYDITGNLIQNESSFLINHINVSDLPSGIYMIVFIKDMSEKIIRRFVKE